MTETVQKLRQKISLADEDYLIGLANKGTYKRACKDAEGAPCEFTENEDSITIPFGGETVTLKDPLEQSSCSCPSRAVCRHIVGALVLLKNTLPPAEVPAQAPAAEDNAEVKQEEAPGAGVTSAAAKAEPEAEKLPPRDEAKVHECAALCRGLLREILESGLVRVPEDMPARIEAAAVRCHAVRAADAERMMRDIGGKLSQHLGRRAAFDGQAFAEKLCRTDKKLARLERDGIPVTELGEFRKSYTEVKGALTLLPIGGRQVRGGEFEGDIFYFLDENKVTGQTFLTMSELRPAYYEKNSRMRYAVTTPWDLGVPIRNVMKSRMVLTGAKVSGEKLSSSGSTRVISQSNAGLNCPAVLQLIKDDFREIAAALDEAGPLETDRLFFVTAAGCRYHRFDKYSQQFIMEIEDWRGCRMKVRAKYQAETKDFIDQLEKIATRMLREKDEKRFTFLGIASIEEGELVLFPVEIYDFITPFDDKQYFLPEKYDGAEGQAVYAEELLKLFAKLRETLYFIVHCGLRSQIRDEDKLARQAKNCGMGNLAAMTEELLALAGAYRHSTGGSTADIMQKMTVLYDYIRAGEKRLQTISALAKMQPEHE